MADVSREIEIVVTTDQAVEAMKELTDALNKNTDKFEESKEEQKEYNKQLKQSTEQGKVYTKVLDNMTGGLFSTVKGAVQSAKAFKGLNAILKASPIFILVAAIGAVITAFTRFEGPLRKVTEILGGLDGVLGVVLDRVGNLGLAIADFVTGDKSSALENWRKTWDGISDAMDSAYKLGVLLARQIRENSVNESARNAVIAKNNRELERQLQITRDFTNSFQVRKRALDETFKIQEENLALTRKNAEEALTIAKNEFELSPAGPTGRKRADAVIALNNAIEEYNNRIVVIERQRRELLNRRFEQLNKENAEQKAITAEMEKQSQYQEAIEEDIEDTVDNYVVLNGELVKLGSEFGEIAEKAAKEREQSYEAAKTAGEDATETQLDLNDAINIGTQAATGLLDVLQGKVKGKDIFKSVLKTISGILSIVLPGAGSAIGGIGSFIGGLFADGGMLEGPPHSRGGVWVNAEGGEGIINKRSMSIPWVRQLASDLNQIGGGVKFADGGIVPTTTSTELQLNQIADALRNERIVLPIPDLITETQKVTTIQERADL